MTLKDLNKEQLRELKIKFLDDLLWKEEHRNISYGEIANIDEIIKDDDKDFVKEYSMYSFVDDDFFTSKEEEK